eukprot:g18101.t1
MVDGKGFCTGCWKWIALLFAIIWLFIGIILLSYGGSAQNDMANKFCLVTTAKYFPSKAGGACKMDAVIMDGVGETYLTEYPVEEAYCAASVNTTKTCFYNNVGEGKVAKLSFASEEMYLDWTRKFMIAGGILIAFFFFFCGSFCAGYQHDKRN